MYSLTLTLTLPTGSLGYFTKTTQKQCNDRCERDKACRSFTTTPDGDCTLNGHDKQEAGKP